MQIQNGLHSGQANHRPFQQGSQFLSGCVFPLNTSLSLLQEEFLFVPMLLVVPLVALIVRFLVLPLPAKIKDQNTSVHGWFAIKSFSSLILYYLHGSPSISAPESVDDFVASGSTWKLSIAAMCLNCWPSTKRHKHHIIKSYHTHKIHPMEPFFPKYIQQLVCLGKRWVQEVHWLSVSHCNHVTNNLRRQEYSCSCLFSANRCMHKIQSEHGGHANT